MQVISHDEYVALAARQHGLVQEIQPQRGSIYMQSRLGDEVPLAITRTHKTIIGSPRDIIDVANTADVLSATLSLDKDALIKKLSKEKHSKIERFNKLVFL